MFMSSGDEMASQYLSCLLEIKKAIYGKSCCEQDEIWIKYYKQITQSGYIVENLPKLLALIHPDFYYKDGVSFDDNLSWKMKTSFTAGITRTDMCQAKEYTGIECILNSFPDIRGKCEADHRWPKALGGPSIIDNRLLLCRFHNGMKSNDISHFNWAEIPIWLKKYIEQIKRLKI